MTRSIMPATVSIAALAFVAVLSAQGCKTTGVGDPCVPEQEYDPTFLGFSELEVNVESRSFQCATRLCLADHFRGRVGCPYGQAKDGTGLGPNGVACTVPSGGAPNCGAKVTGKDASNNYVDPNNQAQVQPQCVDRTANAAVYCSCRCANVDGKTDDGPSYCTCPNGFNCQQLVTSIGPFDTNLPGAYCVKATDSYNPANACVECKAGLNNCASAVNSCAN